MEESPNVQVQSASTAQAASHPSLGTIFPSSQYPAIGFITSPSPQISVHTEAVVASPSVQEYPVSTAQVDEHPSLSSVLESSQYPAIGATTFPSPQISLQLLAVERIAKCSCPISFRCTSRTAAITINYIIVITVTRK